jgi:signal transduction histidine kinase
VEGRKYFTVILRDVSERQRIEQQLRQAERLAEVGTLAAGMAHEIGTPMNVILGRAEQLMRRAEDEATRKGLATIAAQVERITKIMNQLLTFARRKPGERRPVNLGQTIEDCLEVLQERIRRGRITVESNYETLLHPVHVQADPDQMSQVFLNLLINAIHAMSAGGTLRITLQRTNSHVKATVADTGHGIPGEDLPKIFTPFFTTKEAGEGTGLGLTVVHNIVQEHGGSIAVESEPGRGTAFTITLPVAKSI